MTEHSHVWGPLRSSSLSGTVHRKCLVRGCEWVNALDDDPHPYIPSETAANVCGICQVRADYHPEPTYEIVRFRFHSDEREVIATGLTLEEAQAHCSREDTHGPDWFDGYEEE